MTNNPDDLICPHCHEMRNIEVVMKYKPILINDKISQTITYLCNVCSRQFDYDVIIEQAKKP